MINPMHIRLHPLKEVFRNTINLFRAAYHSLKYKDGQLRQVLPPSNYEEVFVDNFDKPLDLNHWRYGQPWGDFHPQYLHQYYDSNGSVSYVSPDKGLVLELRKEAKTYRKSDLEPWRRSENMPDEFTIPVKIGMVSSRRSWQYGWFEAWIQLPEGQPYWPAFWLSGIASWPPEIDILEAYSHHGPKYEAPILFGKWFKKPNRKIQPNLHYGSIEENNKKDYKPVDVPVAKATERYVQYACHWEKDFIKIYYDGILVFETRNPEVLQWYNRSTDQQYVIFNHGLHEHSKIEPTESAMLIKSFKVLKQKNS